MFLMLSSAPGTGRHEYSDTDTRQASGNGPIRGKWAFGVGALKRQEQDGLFQPEDEDDKGPV